jgi:hypothetical protein
VEVGCKEDEEERLQPIVHNPTSNVFKPLEEATVFVNDSLHSLHIPLPNTKEIRYQFTPSSSDRRLAIKGEVKKKAKKD